MDRDHAGTECDRIQEGRTILKGLPEFERALREVEARFRGQALRDAALRSVQPLIRAAAAAAPRSSGKLAGSMTAQSMAFAHEAEAIIRVGPGRPEGSHGILLEYGTIHMTPRPFLALAHAATYIEVLDQFEIEFATKVRE